jgi:N-acetylmuramoyl-L-alanine amidase
MKIALLIGHRSGSQGARSWNKISEYAFWYTYLHTIKAFLPDQHEYVVFERLDEDGSGYRERMKTLGSRMEMEEIDLVVSFHFNSFRNSKVEGFEVLCNTTLASQLYAKSMCEALDNHLSGDNRGFDIVPDDPEIRASGFLYKTLPNSILVESFFGSSPEDMASVVKNPERLFGALSEFFDGIIGE